MAQVRGTPYATRSLVNLLAERCKVIGAVVGQVSGRKMRPEIFNRVEFRSVGGKTLNMQPVFVPEEKCFGFFAPMGRQTVPQKNHRAANVSPQRPKEPRDRRTIDGVVSKREKQPDIASRGSGGKSTDQREPFPGKRLLQAGRLPFGRPRAADARSLGEARFVMKNERGAELPGFFLCAATPL